jgi:hypothetical protein
VADQLLFDRKVKLIVAYALDEDYKSVSARAVEIEGLRVQFKISKSLHKDPNTAEITVTNLSERSRAEMMGKGAKVILQAGYSQTISQIFHGDARLIEHTREGVDWTTKIQTGDGERAFVHARINESFKSGTPLSGVINKVANKIGLGVGNLASASGLQSKQYVSGYAARGKASKELDNVLKAAGYEWSIQDGALQILRPGATTEEIIELNEDHGLIGSPEHGTPVTKGGPPVLKIKSLLQPHIKPGCRVKLKSQGYDGLFRVLKLEHEGDTAGGSWYTSFEGSAL